MDVLSRNWIARNWLTVPVLLVAAALLAACDEGEGAEGQPAVPRLEITVSDTGIEPQSIEVQPPDTYQVVVHNEGSQECSFNLGDYLRDLVVPAGGTEEINVQLPPDTLEGEQAMGCAGSDDQTGQVIVREGTVVD